MADSADKDNNNNEPKKLSKNEEKRLLKAKQKEEEKAKKDAEKKAKQAELDAQRAAKAASKPKDEDEEPDPTQYFENRVKSLHARNVNSYPHKFQVNISVT